MEYVLKVIRYMENTFGELHWIFKWPFEFKPIIRVCLSSEFMFNILSLIKKMAFGQDQVCSGWHCFHAL